jgi:hypothetical protein
MTKASRGLLAVEPEACIAVYPLLFCRCARFGLPNDATRATLTGAFDNFHVAYHGTKIASLLGALDTAAVFCAPWYLSSSLTCVLVSGLHKRSLCVCLPTRVSSLGVLNTGTLAKAGDTVFGGAIIGIREGHIPEPFERDNLYTRKREMFDPNQVFVCCFYMFAAFPLVYPCSFRLWHCRFLCLRHLNTVWILVMRQKPGGLLRLCACVR